MKTRPSIHSRAPFVALLALVLLGVPPRQALALPWPQIPGWQPPGQYSSLGARPRYVLLLVLDGGVPSYLHLAQFPHIAALQREGTTYLHAWDGMLESETPTGHASLGTGTLPRRHGILSFSWIDARGVRHQPTDPIPIQRGDLEQVLIASGVPSLASELKAADPSATVAATSGHKDYAVDAVGGPAADYLMYYTLHRPRWTPVAIPRHVPPRSVLQAPGLTAIARRLRPGDQDSLAMQLALSSFRQLHPRVTIVNLPEFDWPLGHLKGGAADSWDVWRLMTRLDADIGTFEAELSAEHLLKDTLFVITADHGMVEVTHRIPHAIIAGAVSRAGTTLADYQYHSGGFLWLRDRKRSSAAAANLAALHAPAISAVYYRAGGYGGYVLARSPRRAISPSLNRAYRYLLGTLSNPAAPQIVVFLKENSTIVGRNEVGWKGDHGGASWGAQHIPLILSGPGVRHGLRSGYPATIYDVTPTILTVLGIHPHDMDGIALSDALTDPDDADIAAQEERGAVLDPLVNALRAQSRAETGKP